METVSTYARGRTPTSLPSNNKTTITYQLLMAVTPLLSAFCYTWVFGQNNLTLRMAQSLGWFMISLAARRAVLTSKSAPENSLWALGAIVLFISIQKATAIFDPLAIFAIIAYAALSLHLQVSTIATMPKTNYPWIIIHSGIAGALFYFLLEEYIFLDGLWFWIAVCSAAGIAMASVKKFQALQAASAA